VRIAVFGANGQLGSDVVKIAKENSIETIPIMRKQFDIETDELENMRLDTDYIINCMAYTQVDNCEDHQQTAMQSNAIFPHKLAQFCRKRNITLFHISTDYVFGGDKSSLYTEEDSINPVNIYGISKAAGDFAVRNYMDRYFIFRISSLFGRAGVGGKGGNFIETMLRFAKQGKKIKVVDNQTVSPTHTLDVARAIITFIKDTVCDYGTYHCCNTGSCSWYEFAKAIFEIAGIDADIKSISNYPTKAERPNYSAMNNSKLSKYYRMKKWEEAVKEYFFISGR